MSELLPALERLDVRLRTALATAAGRAAIDAALAPYQGLFVGEREAAGLLERPPGASALWSGESAGEPDPGTPLGWLARTFELDDFELDVVLLALAPEVDPRYERIYAFLQEDVTRRRPTVGLALDLLCRTPAERLARRECFAPSAPLVGERLLQVEPAGATLLDAQLALDGQITAVLLGDDGLDPRLAGGCELVWPRGGGDGELDEQLARAVGDAFDERVPLRLCFTGPRDSIKRRVAEEVAALGGVPLLVCDLARVDAALVAREAALRDAVLLVEDAEPGSALDALLTAGAGVMIVTAERPPAGAAGLVPVPFGVPAAPVRAATWERELEAAGVDLKADTLRALGGRFRLTRDQIAGAAASAPGRAAVRGAPRAEREDVFAAARAQTGHELAALATQVECRVRWQDLVVAGDVLAQLRELCARVSVAETVLGEWGFGARLTRGRGVSALFAGAPGTGKTLAAEVIAGELGLHLFRIELAGVVSKYIGETEKNLDRIFAAAEGANAILLFDEADALFGKRSEVRDSHDRYANLEVSYLLQKMEAFDGIAILTTNLRQNVDDAFARRLAFTVHFAFPDEAARRQLWAGAWTALTPVAPDVELDLLARLVLSGGNIRNAALAAAFLAAEEGTAVGMQHVARALRREYAKLGKGVSDETLRELLAEPVTA